MLASLQSSDIVIAVLCLAIVVAVLAMWLAPRMKSPAPDEDAK